MTPIHYEVYKLCGYVWEYVQHTTDWVEAWSAKARGLTVIKVNSTNKTRVVL